MAGVNETIKARFGKLLKLGKISKEDHDRMVGVMAEQNSAPQVSTGEKAEKLGVPADLVSAVTTAISAINVWVAAHSTAPNEKGEQKPTHKARWFLNSKAEELGKGKGKAETAPTGETAPETPTGETAPTGETLTPETVPPTPETDPETAPKGKGKGKNSKV